eukprot:CAMPEP_0197323102 /NCGR_PEP_ID=MMETSP0891-20130614/70306_1 /TAXON_ID=44058 ORGANISM="Aureoumbra lagunensis, Strain CCMP1510" /NCGR_SAMPLE_ID=MMETSP0891 /ASSEMBLY_ACC=CAM_ASM_000534 /LENGTH=600 /DNA_ID=CAMNT_0042815657 /DNA_START=73 /DNA_END=1876 /DNA_ORIENTATION=+
MINEVEKSGRFVKIKKWTKIDAENCESSLLEKYKVSAVPTLVFLFGKDSIWRTLEGADSALAFQTISEFDQAEAAVPEDEEKYDTLETKLQQLIRIAPVMVFMKGSPSEPRCKFSRALMEILQGIEFASFDILRDDEVRQGLKVYWPTYPQIYIQGKLLGGLDNIKELVSSASSSETKEKIKSLKDIILELRLKNLIQKAPVMLFMKGEPTAPRCGFSRTICEILSNADIQFDSFDILEDNDIRQGLKTYSQWPTYPQVYVNGELVGGLDIIQELLADSSQSLKGHLGLPESSLEINKQNITATTDAMEIDNAALNARLKSLTHRADVMLFMKGNPDTPRCGFSRTICEILSNADIQFDSFDILEDNDIRQGLKTYSQWPTYPQVYVNGELVGGLDIIQELLADSSQSLKGHLGLPESSLEINKQNITATTDAMEIDNAALNARLKSLTHRADVMLFMKGNPDTPRCGFSRTICEILSNADIQFDSFDILEDNDIRQGLKSFSICEILSNADIQFDSFDILEDNDIRQGLKSFSQWPTYPQLYVKGSLVGGLDIVQEMARDGNLKDNFLTVLNSLFILLGDDTCHFAPPPESTLKVSSLL